MGTSCLDLLKLKIAIEFSEKIFNINFNRIFKIIKKLN